MSLLIRNSPVIRILLPFSLGLLVVFYSECVFSDYLFFEVLGVVGFLLMILLFRKWKSRTSNYYFGIIASFSFFFLGILSANNSSVTAGKDFQEGYYVAILESQPIEKSNSYSAQLKVFLQEVDSSEFQDFDATVIAYFEKEALDSLPRIGDVIYFTGYFTNNTSNLLPLQFDYIKYLQNMGIAATVYIPKSQYSKINKSTFSFQVVLNQLRSSLLATLNQNHPPQREFGVIAALVLGDRTFLDSILKNQFSKVGVVHILAVSGLHVGIIYFLFSRLLQLFLKDKKSLLRFILIIFILWTYAAITGFSPSVLRASTMFTFIALGKYFDRNGNIYNLIAASAFFLLLINPLLITQVGFQLSYLAVVGIVYFFPKLYSLLTFQSWIMDKTWTLICVSLAAQITTFPLSIFYFHQFPLLFPITNIIAVPLATLILYSGIFWLIVGWIPHLNKVLEFITIHLANILNQAVEWLNTIPFVNAEDLFIQEVELFLLYGLIIIVPLFIKYPKSWKLKAIGIMTSALVLLYAFTRFNEALQDEVLLVKSKGTLFAIHLIKDELFLYGSNEGELKELMKRELRPFLLSKGLTAQDKWVFIREQKFLYGSIESRLNKEDHIHLLILRDDPAAVFKSSTQQDHPQVIPIQQGLTSINSDEFICFSTDQLPLPKSLDH